MLTLHDYRTLARQAPAAWDPDPYLSHPRGPWHAAYFKTVVEGVTSLLERFDAGQVSEAHLLRGKDNGLRKRDTLSYWLYFQHHPGNEYWKLVGQRYWSVSAWRAWRDHARHQGLPTSSMRSLPKRSRSGELGLVSEHVVPKKVLKREILFDRANLQLWLSRNLCSVVTIREDRRLHRDDHPEPSDPWRRYIGTGIVFLHNPDWTDGEIEPLLRCGLLGAESVRPDLSSLP